MTPQLNFMVGILLLTHAPLGNAFIEAATHVFRMRPERLESIDVRADQDTAEVNQLAKAAIARIDDGTGVLVITDVMGGTPSNCCFQLGEPGHDVASRLGGAGRSRGTGTDRHELADVFVRAGAIEPGWALRLGG